MSMKVKFAMEKWNGSLSLNSEMCDSDSIMLLLEVTRFWVWEQESLFLTPFKTDLKAI